MTIHVLLSLTVACHEWRNNLQFIMWHFSLLILTEDSKGSHVFIIDLCKGSHSDIVAAHSWDNVRNHLLFHLHSNIYVLPGFSSQKEFQNYHHHWNCLRKWVGYPCRAQRSLPREWYVFCVSWCLSVLLWFLFYVAMSVNFCNMFCRYFGVRSMEVDNCFTDLER